MDKSAQCCCCSLCCGSKCCSMLQLYVGRALDAAKILNLCIKRSKKVPWQTDIKQIFRQNLTEEIKCVAFIIVLVDVNKHQQNKLCWDQLCVATSARTGVFGPNVLTCGCPGDMSPTCWLLSQPGGKVETLAEPDQR